MLNMDGLSCASGVAAVVSITFQLAQGIQKLIEFWSAVNDAPERVRDIFDHLKLLSTILHDFKDLPMEDGFTKILAKALSNCEKHVSNLEKKIACATRHSSSNNRWKRRWADLNITLKDREVRDLQESIREAFQLVKGVQISSLMRITQQNATTTREILATVQNMTVSSATQRTPHIVQNHIATVLDNNLPPGYEAHYREAPVYEAYYREAPSLVQPRANYSDNAGFMLAKRRRRYKSQRSDYLQNAKSKEASYLFYPPKLLARIGMSYGMHFSVRATAGWQYTIHIFRAVPETAPIFTFCQDGNIAAVRSMLRDGHASPWDRDPEGRTPLWVASKSSNIEIVEYLLSVGADSQARGSKSNTLPIQEANFNCRKNLDGSIAIIDALQNQINDSDETVFDRHVPTIMLLYHRPSVYKAHGPAMKIIQHFLPRLEPDDPRRAKMLFAALNLGFSGYPVEWMLQYMPPVLIEYDNMSCLHEAIVKRIFQRDPKSIRLIAQRTKDIHRLFKIEYAEHTPTSLSLCLPDIFHDWRNLLLDLRLDIEAFIAEELATEGGLADAGWTMESLNRLFRLEFAPRRPESQDGNIFPSCDRCNATSTATSTSMLVDLEWRRLLREIRTGRFDADSIIGDTISRTWGCSYKLVCPRECRDGTSLSHVYDNVDMNEPPLPPFTRRKTGAEIELEAEEAARGKDDCPTRRMPGAFV